MYEGGTSGGGSSRRRSARSLFVTDSEPTEIGSVDASSTPLGPRGTLHQPAMAACQLVSMASSEATPAMEAKLPSVYVSLRHES